MGVHQCTFYYRESTNTFSIGISMGSPPISIGISMGSPPIHFLWECANALSIIGSPPIHFYRDFYGESTNFYRDFYGESTNTFSMGLRSLRSLRQKCTGGELPQKMHISKKKCFTAKILATILIQSDSIRNSHSHFFKKLQFTLYHHLSAHRMWQDDSSAYQYSP